MCCDPLVENHRSKHLREYYKVLPGCRCTADDCVGPGLSHLILILFFGIMYVCICPCSIQKRAPSFKIASIQPTACDATLSPTSCSLRNTFLLLIGTYLKYVFPSPAPPPPGFVLAFTLQTGANTAVNSCFSSVTVMLPVSDLQSWSC